MMTCRLRRLGDWGVMLAVWCGLAAGRPWAAGEVGVIPRPMTVETGQGTFALNEKAVIRVAGGSTVLAATGRFLRDRLKQEYGVQLGLDETTTGAAAGGEVRLSMVADRNDLGREGYELVITPQTVAIRAATPTGVFWGTQTVLQLVAVAATETRLGSATKSVALPVVRIVDQPRFAWRGLMLDCSRTFLTIDVLKKYVDRCAFYKMNVLQLHLTDDQGWRLEIRKHPRLTEVGAKFAPCFPGEVSEYYTQQQMKDLVRYAADRCVTIVPEIEMPSHCLGLLATYPELSCREGKDTYVIAPYMFLSDPDPKKTPPTPHGVLCAGNEKTFQVLEDVLQEVIDLFPSEYIHIAGDECPKSYWKACPKCQARMKAEGLRNEEELQSYFVKRVAKMVQDRGRKVLGWDEVLEGGLAPQVAVMGWRGMDLTTAAAKMGHPVIMAQKSHLYFDYCYNRTPASLVYAFEPMPPELSGEQQRLVLGVEACLWTHLARTERMIDMMIFPRVLALAEVGWTSVNRRQWEDFSTRMNLHEPILEAKGVHCFKRNEGAALPNLSAGQDGRLWLVNSAGEIYLRKGDAWERFPGQARQVTSGPDGTIWSVSTQPTRRGYVLMRWVGKEAEDRRQETGDRRQEAGGGRRREDRRREAGGWRQGEWRPIGEDVAAVQISAAPDGSLWTATEAYAIWRYADGRWANVRGLAREVSVGPDGMAWILTGDPAPGGFELFSTPPGGRWRRVAPLRAHRQSLKPDRLEAGPTQAWGQALVGGVHIAAGPVGQLWLMRDDGSLRSFAGGLWQERPGKASHLAVTKDGEVWALANAATGPNAVVLKWTGQDWQDVGPVP